LASPPQGGEGFLIHSHDSDPTTSGRHGGRGRAASQPAAGPLSQRGGWQPVAHLRGSSTALAQGQGWQLPITAVGAGASTGWMAQVAPQGAAPGVPRGHGSRNRPLRQHRHSLLRAALCPTRGGETHPFAARESARRHRQLRTGGPAGDQGSPPASQALSRQRAPQLLELAVPLPVCSGRAMKTRWLPRCGRQSLLPAFKCWLARGPCGRNGGKPGRPRRLFSRIDPTPAVVSESCRSGGPPARCGRNRTPWRW